MENENANTNVNVNGNVNGNANGSGNVPTDGAGQKENANIEKQMDAQMLERDFEGELAKAMAEIKKLKATADKNASEAADFKKKWRSTLDEQQRLSLEKEEEDKALREELASLRREKEMSGIEKQFLELGYTSDMASKAALAQLEGDTGTLLSVQKEFIEQAKKDLKAQLTKNMPIPPIGNDSKGITKEQFDKMSLAERSELYKKDKALYESLAK